MSDNLEAGDGCICPLGRRRFLRLSAASILAALVADGLPLESALGLESAPEPIAGRSDGRAEVTKYAIPAGDAVQFDKDNGVILVRHAGHVYAFNLSCPHQNAALRWVDEDGGRFQCPKHKSRYSADGTFQSGRATRSMDRFTIRREGDEVAVNLDQLWRQDEHPAEWAAAELGV